MMSIIVEHIFGFLIIAILMFVSLFAQSTLLTIFLSLAFIFWVYSFIITYRCRDYFKVKTPKKWSEIKCRKCGFLGKPVHYAPGIYIPILLLSLLRIPRLLVYCFKQYPIEYGCPKCADPRRNYKDIEYIGK